MKIFKITFTIVLFMVCLLALKIYSDFNISRELKIEEKKRLKKSTDILNECFDLKNKSKRTHSDSIRLIEFCLEEYGS